MKAVQFNNGIRIIDSPRPDPPKSEAVIRVLMAGICNTDIELARGYMNFRGIPGHEFVGIVEQCDDPALIAKRVVGEINSVCHACDFCKRNMPHHCANRTVLGILGRAGAFAEYVSLPIENLDVVPDAIPNEIAVFTEPVAAAFRIHEQIDVNPGDRVIVLGDGKLGLLCAQVMRLKSNQVQCIGKHTDKLKTLDNLGIETRTPNDPLEPNADIVVEATGSADGLKRALQLVRPEGAIILKTTVAHETALDFSLPVINEVRIIGSRCGPFPPALDALAKGSVRVSPMIHATYALEDAIAALEHAQRPGVLKVLLNISE
ncbi:MAG: alcohol dehydrogenase catalytic domain-containing protein [Candidatus Hydrogenedentes bacterium]|nr:alcohol dehydrogenase catalytic domain-containing protein [Candidatus Hydrogenedentota bacterium]